jgi:hypothetical protein
LRPGGALKISSASSNCAPNRFAIQNSGVNDPTQTLSLTPDVRAATSLSRFANETYSAHANHARTSAVQTLLDVAAGAAMMSLVRLLGFTTLGCGCVTGRYREIATNREITYVEEKGLACDSTQHRRNHTLASARSALSVLSARAS